MLDTYINGTDNITDINECNDRANYPCYVKDTCNNTEGGFECICPPNYPKGNALNGTCEKENSFPLKVTISIGTIPPFNLFVRVLFNTSPWTPPAAWAQQF